MYGFNPILKHVPTFVCLVALYVLSWPPSSWVTPVFVFGCGWLSVVALVEILYSPILELGEAVLDDSSDEEDQVE